MPLTPDPGLTPEDHVSRFPKEWWTERSTRDYYVDALGCVKLRGDSPTAIKVAEALRVKAAEIALEITNVNAH